MSNTMQDIVARSATQGNDDVVIDVGANAGDFAIELAAKRPVLRVIAIEPIPELCRQMDETAETRHLTNVEIWQVAIDLTESMARFNVSNHFDQGISSLLDFDDSAIRRNEYWSQRPDLHFDRIIDVPVRRLDTMLERCAPRRIRFIKIDAQGKDLDVLASLGRYLPLTDGGMLEIPATPQTMLYAGEQHDLRSALHFLEKHSFTTYAIKPNDHSSNEYNVFFCRKGLDFRTFETELGLRGIKLYDGKHYWHCPSDKLEPVEAQLAESRENLVRLGQSEVALRARLGHIEAALRARLGHIETALHAEHAESDRLRTLEIAQSSRIAQLENELDQLKSLFVVRAFNKSVRFLASAGLKMQSRSSRSNRPKKRAGV